MSSLSKARICDELRRVALGAYRKDRQIRGELVRKIPLNVNDDGIQHLVFATKFEHLEIGNIDGGRGAAAFESKLLELIAISYIVPTTTAGNAFSTAAWGERRVPRDRA
jgi:hypothetical protein